MIHCLKTMNSESKQQTFFEDTGPKPPALISACLLGIPCRYHGRRAKKRDDLIERLQQKYVLVPVCPEQLGGMPTPRTSEYLPQGKTGRRCIGSRFFRQHLILSLRNRKNNFSPVHDVGKKMSVCLISRTGDCSKPA